MLFFFSQACDVVRPRPQRIQSNLLFTMQTLLTFCSLPIFQLCVLWRIEITIYLTEYERLTPSRVRLATVMWIKTLVIFNTTTLFIRPDGTN